MLRALIFSLIVHMILFSLAFFIKEQRKESKPEFFYTRIISPDELQKPNDRNIMKREIIPNEKISPPSNIQKIKPPSLREQLPPPPQKKKELTNKDLPKKLDQQGKPSSDGTEALNKKIPETEVSGRRDEISIKDFTERQQKESTKDKLFDKDVIGKLAQKDRETKSDSSITFSTKEFQYQGYMQRLKEKIEGIWKYPRDAAERGIYGDLYIRFTIKKNGRLGSVDLLRTSGYKSLDDAAIKALRDAEPYWPLPDDWGRDGLTITGHFVYTHYGGYIR